MNNDSYIQLIDQITRRLYNNEQLDNILNSYSNTYDNFGNMTINFRELIEFSVKDVVDEMDEIRREYEQMNNEMTHMNDEMTQIEHETLIEETITRIEKYITKYEIFWDEATKQYVIKNLKKTIDDAILNYGFLYNMVSDESDKLFKDEKIKERIKQQLYDNLVCTLNNRNGYRSIKRTYKK